MGALAWKMKPQNLKSYLSLCGRAVLFPSTTYIFYVDSKRKKMVLKLVWFTHTIPRMIAFPPQGGGPGRGPCDSLRRCQSKRVCLVGTQMPSGEGNGNPLQESCLENPVDGGARWAAVHRVAQSRTRLKQLGMRWRRKWQPNPVFLPGESQGRRSLVGCRLWGRTELDTTEAP